LTSTDEGFCACQADGVGSFPRTKREVFSGTKLLAFEFGVKYLNFEPRVTALLHVHANNDCPGQSALCVYMLPRKKSDQCGAELSSSLPASCTVPCVWKMPSKRSSLKASCPGSAKHGEKHGLVHNSFLGMELEAL